MCSDFLGLTGFPFAREFTVLTAVCVLFRYLFSIARRRCIETRSIGSWMHKLTHFFVCTCAVHPCTHSAFFFLPNSLFLLSVSLDVFSICCCAARFGVVATRAPFALFFITTSADWWCERTFWTLSPLQIVIDWIWRLLTRPRWTSWFRRPRLLCWGRISVSVLIKTVGLILEIQTRSYRE